jgi:hypothetical protein
VAILKGQLMLRDDTIFRRLPDKLDRVELRFLEAIRFGIQSADLSYRRLGSQLIGITKLCDEKGEIPKDAFPAAISDAWTFVDAAHRLSEVVERTPNLKLKAPAIALFMRAAETLNELRNSFHHARQDFFAIDVNETAIWGVVAWCVPRSSNHGTIFTLVPGTMFEGNYPMLNPVGHTINGPVDMVTLIAFTRKADLSDIYRKLAGLADHLETELDKRMTGMGGSMCDGLVSADMKSHA